MPAAGSSHSSPHPSPSTSHAGITPHNKQQQKIESQPKRAVVVVDVVVVVVDVVVVVVDVAVVVVFVGIFIVGHKNLTL